MGGGDKGEIKNILLQIDRINYKPESPLQESLEVRPGAFYFVWGPLSGGFFKSFVDFTGQHETVATSRASHRVDENTTFIKTSGLDRLDDYFNIFFSIS